MPLSPGSVRVLQTTAQPMLLLEAVCVVVTKDTVALFKFQEMRGPAPALMSTSVQQTPTVVPTTATTPSAPFLARATLATL